MTHLSAGRSLIALFALVLGVSGRAVSQTRTEIIRGRVTTDSGVPILGARIVATMAPERNTFQTASDTLGLYMLTIVKGTGDYLVHISTPLRAPFRKRVTRVGADSVFVVDAALAPDVQQLTPARVRATRPVPTVEANPYGPEAGASERILDGVSGQLPPDQATDLASVASTSPGVSLTDGGISVLGLPSSQNRTTLNGLSFSGADLPRDARTLTRVATSTYDPSRGWFSGANVNVDLARGSTFAGRRGRLTLDAPPLQDAIPTSGQFGQRFHALQASYGADGPLTDGDKWFYNLGFQGSRKSSNASSILDADADLLQSAGVAADSVLRFLLLQSAAGIPVTRAGVPQSRLNDAVSFIGRVDHSASTWETTQPAQQGLGLTGYVSWARAQALGLGPTETPGYGGERWQGTGGLQAEHTVYFGNDYLTDTRSAFSMSRSRTKPYRDLPNGSVQVLSNFADGTEGLASLQFGGNGALDVDSRQWTWETTNETQLYSHGLPNHRVKINLTSRFDGYSRLAQDNPLGAYSYNSLADFVANQPTMYSRTLNATAAQGGEWNGFASVGDLWRVAEGLQVMYGVRLEGNVFTSTPALNPEAARTFLVRTDAAPNTWDVSPRLGFSRVWAGSRRPGLLVTPLGSFVSADRSYIRGGFGEFRNMLPPDQLAGAAQKTGLPNGRQQLTCVGPAVPTPLWSSFAADPTTIPSRCANSLVSVFSDGASAVEVFDQAFTAPRSWRGNLAYGATHSRLSYSLDATYSLNVDQPGVQNLNFSGIPRFSLANEGGRPVYVGEQSIVDANGAISPVESRVSPAFGPVMSNVSTLRSTTQQLLIQVQPDLSGLTNWFVSIAYANAFSRAITSGFDKFTSGDPRVLETARGDLDARHRFWIQSGYAISGLAFSLTSQVSSGLPFTPIVGGDVNGDGFINDRAFIFSPTGVADPTLSAGLRSLLSSSSKRIRDCLDRQLGQIAGSNSCEGPWTARVNAQVSMDGELLRLGERVKVSVNFANPLGAIDHLLHGNSLQGWGTPAVPDPTLLQVRGFDPTRQVFLYAVNTRFGTSNPITNAIRAPFRATIDVSIDLGRPFSEQQIDRWLKPGRGGRPGPRLTADELKRRYQRNVLDPYGQILQETDSLLLSRDQFEAIQRVRATYRQRMDSLWTALANDLAALGDSFDVGTALERQEGAVDAAWEITRQDVQRTLKDILTPVQIRLMPYIAGVLYAQKVPYGPKNRFRFYPRG